MSNFHVGQKVAATTDLECGVESGEVFTISRIEIGEFVAYDGKKQTLSLHFHERYVRNGYSGFDPRFFKPVVERKPSIEIFKAMLNKPTVRIDA